MYLAQPRTHLGTYEWYPQAFPILDTWLKLFWPGAISNLEYQFLKLWLGKYIVNCCLSRDLYNEYHSRYSTFFCRFSLHMNLASKLHWGDKRCSLAGRVFAKHVWGYKSHPYTSNPSIQEIEVKVTGVQSHPNLGWWVQSQSGTQEIVTNK